jgi:hypothetical protein
MSLPSGQRNYLSRWTISAAVVVFAHVGIAGAVLTWRKVIAPPEFPGPVVVNLIPEPPAPSPTDRAPVKSRGTPEKPSDQNQEHRNDSAASKREDTTEPKPIEQPSVTVSAPPSDGGKTELGVDTQTGTGGGAPARHADRGSSNPIDMINPGMPSNKGAKPNDQRKALKDLLARLAMHPGGQHPASIVFRSVSRNAIGALEQDRGRVTGAVESSTTRPATGTSHPATNAIGATVVLPQNDGGPVTRPRPTTPLASNSAASPNSGISGTDLRRPGFGAPTIGGPSRAANGGINGTSFRSR